jgi:Tol biopolymer transport system component
MKSIGCLAVSRFLAMVIVLAWGAVAMVDSLPLALAQDLSADLKKTGYKIVYETYQDGNWELFLIGVDGSKPVNLTRTPQVHELHPKVSPDGTKIAFVIDQGQGEATVRSLYYMNFDGTGRTLVAADARWPCWSPDGQAIAYLKQEGDGFAYNDPYTKGLVVYDLGSGKHRQHPNQEIHHIYNPCWSLDGKWFLATVSGGMGYRHTNLALAADAARVIDLGLPGCRPDISADGKRVAWGASDWTMRVGELDLSGPEPKVIQTRDVVTSPKPLAIYHTDWSPDGKYVAFSRGAVKKRLGPHPAIIGVQAEGWDICVADVSRQDCWVTITTDGKSNKEPDWVPVR